MSAYATAYLSRKRFRETMRLRVLYDIILSGRNKCDFFERRENFGEKFTRIKTRPDQKKKENE